MAETYGSTMALGLMAADGAGTGAIAGRRMSIQAVEIAAVTAAAKVTRRPADTRKAVAVAAGKIPGNNPGGIGWGVCGVARGKWIAQAPHPDSVVL
jgi:hypothetical protein